MPLDVAERRAAATLAYENAGREITQAFGTLSSNLTLAAGTLGALLTVLGAGELFGHDIVVQVIGHAVKPASVPDTRTLAGIPRLSNVSVLLLGAAFPLLIRFFVRATFGYQQLLRFNLIQRSTWDYISGQARWELPRAATNVYVQEWKSPTPARSLLWGSFKYGFAWVFALATVAFAWGAVTAPGVLPRIVAGVFVIVGVGWELVTLVTSPYLKCPTNAELQSLKRLQPGRRTQHGLHDAAGLALVLLLGRRKILRRTAPRGTSSLLL